MTIKIFKGSVTDGGTDGTLLSQSGNSNPLRVRLDAVNNEISDPITMAIRCDEGELTDLETVLALVGDSAAKWALALYGEAFGAYGDPLTFPFLNRPGQPESSTATTGGTLATGTYNYRVTAYNANGETMPSLAQEQVVPEGTSTNTVTLTWDAVAGATGYKIYGRTADGWLLMDTTANTTWSDDGSITPAGAMPTTSPVQISDKNTLFQIKAKAVDTEEPANDNSVVLNVTGSVEAY